MTTPDHTPGHDDLIERARTIAAAHLDADMSDVFSGGYDSSPVVCAVLDALQSANVPALVEALREALDTIELLIADLRETDADAHAQRIAVLENTATELRAAHTKEASNG